jgi:hypothetical protein
LAELPNQLTGNALEQLAPLAAPVAVWATYKLPDAEQIEAESKMVVTTRKNFSVEIMLDVLMSFMLP